MTLVCWCHAEDYFSHKNECTGLLKYSGTKCATTDKNKNWHLCFHLVLIWLVSQVQQVTAVVILKPSWFHPIFLSCFNCIFIKKKKLPTRNCTAHSQLRTPRNTSQPSPSISVFSSLFMLQLLFSFLLSRWWFPKYDIISQRLSEGSVTHGALADATLVWLVWKKKHIPSKILCRGVESWTVTGVYLCHTHQQDVNHRTQNKHTGDCTSHWGQDSTVTVFGNDGGLERRFPFPQMKRCLFGTEARARQAAQHQTGTSWHSFLPAMSGEWPLIKQQDTWQKQQLIKRVTHTPHMSKFSQEKRWHVNAYHTAKETCHQHKHTSNKRTAFNQDAFFSCQMFVKYWCVRLRGWSRNYISCKNISIVCC